VNSASKNTVLVLGAGASKPYGFPTGMELRDILISLNSYDIAMLNNPAYQQAKSDAFRGGGIADPSAFLKEDARLRKLQTIIDTVKLDDGGANSVLDFANAFKFSGTKSIDTFLARRTEFEVAGKKAIASVILKCEQENDLYQWDWYGVLWDALIPLIEKHKNSGVAKFLSVGLEYLPLKIITFNYDRSLEYFLWNALQHTFGISKDAAFEDLKSLNIVHVYGSLGPIWGNDSVEYGNHVIDAVNRGSNSITLIRENNRTDNQKVKDAQSLLREADTIVFMGFGFDHDNCSLLNLGAHCPRVGGIYATNLGMTSQERIIAKKNILEGFSGCIAAIGLDPADNKNYSCLDLVRGQPIFQS